MSHPRCVNCGESFAEGDDVHEVRRVTKVGTWSVTTDRIGLEQSLAHEECPE